MATNKKICLLGKSSVGKTALAHRFVFDQFDAEYQPTYGMRVLRKRLSAASGRGITDLTLLIWDIAGDDLLRQHSSYLRRAEGAVLVCDSADPASLYALEPLVRLLHSANSTIQALVAASKCDLVSDHHVHAEFAEYTWRWGIPCIEVSAKTGQGVAALFAQLAYLMADGREKA